MNHVALFNGIGGFQLAAQWMGWSNLAHVETDEFCNRVVAHHFPESKQYDDIKEFAEHEAAKYRGRCDIITGGFPCQPYSHAGKREGSRDDRHLWPEMLATIQAVAPRYVVGENVSGLVNWEGGVVFEEVCADLENEGYQVQPVILPAAGVGAPHRRDRVWIVANANGCNGGRSSRYHEGKSQKERIPKRDQVQQPFESAEVFRNDTDPISEGREGGEQHGAPEEGERKQEPSGPTPELFEGPDWEQFPTQPPLCGGDDGLPGGLDGITLPKWRRESIKALGNAIVPQVAYEIFRAITETDNPQQP